MNVKKIKIVLLGLLSLVSIGVYADDVVNIPLNTGKILNLQHYSYKTIYIANDQIAGFTIQSPGILYITGRTVGSTTLYAMDKSGQVVLRKTLRVTPNLDELRAEIRRISPNTFISVTTLGNNVVLRGAVPSPGIGAKIREATIRYAGDPNQLIDYMTISKPAQIYIRVKIVEISRGVSRMIGLKSWSMLYHSDHFNIGGGNSATASGLLLNGLNGLTDNLSNGFNMAGFFEALDEDHLVRILSEPNLTALSGQQATFFAGGEFPILVPQTSGVGVAAINTVVYQQFGVSLNFIPTLLEQDIINLQVGTEVSEVSNQQAVRISGNVVPSLATRRASTVVQLRSGQSFAIAGLVQDNLRDAIQRFPLLGRLPILGPLFNSRDFQQDQSELVIIVTPYLVNPVSRRLATPIDGVSREDVSRYDCMLDQQNSGCSPNQASQLRYLTE